MSDDLRIVACNAESVLSGLADQLQNGPTLRIVHRFWHPGTQCLAGEEVWSIALLHRGKELCLPLSLALRLVLNHLAETRHVPQSATQIAAGMRRSPFYVKHGANSGIVSRRRIARSAVKEYIKRLRRALAHVFREAGLNLDPMCALVSHKTMGTEVQYQLLATVRWVHVSED